MQEVKACFNWAVKEELLDKSPFYNIKTGTTRTDDKKEYIELERVRSLFPYTSTEERAFLLLVRRLGLRAPSETNALTWNNVDFNDNTITILSSKTSRYNGKDKRTAPLFADVKSVLLELKQEQERGGVRSPFVFPTIRGDGAEVRKVFYRLFKRAGVSWNKLFQNLRLSASVDILRAFGVDAESFWVGHSATMRELHYRGIPAEVVQSAQQWEL